VAFDENVRFADKPTKHAFIPDLDAFRATVVEGLDALALFQRVQTRGEVSDTRGQVLEQAWEARDDLVLDLEVRSYHQELLGHTGSLLWFVLYASYVFPAWYVPIDRYGGGLEVHVRLGSVQQGADPLLDETYFVRPEEVSQEFTPDQRELAGFLDLGALWNVETSLEESNWKAIERGVGPHTQRRFLVKLLRDIEARVASDLRSGATTTREKLLSKIRKRFAIVAGVSAYEDPAIGTCPFAARDAEAVASLFASETGGGLVEGREMLLLTDGQATRDSILEGIALVASRATASDEIIIFLSGYGTTVSGRPPDSPAAAALGGVAGSVDEAVGGARAVFLPQDAQASTLGDSGLTLEDLGHALEGGSAERVVLIFDTSFSARGPRTVTGSTETPRPAGLAHDLRMRPGRAALFAAQPEGAAHDLVGAEAGLFSHVLCSGLAGAADRDGDGLVDLVELFGYAKVEVQSRAGLEGFEQKPLSLNVDSGSFSWPR
jgi:hypothetical protein